MPRTLTERVRDGDYRARLEALLYELTDAWAEATPGVKAQLAGQIRDTMAKLEALPSVEASDVDDLRDYRAARRAAADARMRAKRRKGRGA